MVKKKKKTEVVRDLIIRSAVETGRFTSVLPNAVEVPNRLDVRQVQAAIETLRSAEAFYLAACSRIVDGGEMPQDLVAVAAFADQARETLGRIYKAFESTAEKLRMTQGSFAPGRLQVVFEFKNGKRTVAWKEEATKRAAEACAATGGVFDAKAYQACVLNLTPPAAGSYEAKIQERT